MLVLTIITAVLFVLKAAGFSACSWWLVFSPLLCAYALQILQLIIALILHGDRVKNFTFTLFYEATVEVTFKE